MPNDTRALTRAARARARAAGENYTEARTAVLVIRERMAEADETYEQAEAWYDDPANQPLCQACGWSRGMVCPECRPGCGCSVGCSGWRHREWGPNAGDDDLPDDGPDVCECGADNEYSCVC
jgi:hypothetical protein